MARWIYLVSWMAAVVMAGCSGNTSPPTPTVEPKTAAADAPPSASPTLKAAPSSAGVPSPKVETPPAASPVRDLVARYLEGDGQSGWRKNEAAATELEKLGSEETTLLWPLLADPQADVRRGAAVFLLDQFDPADSSQVAAFARLLDDRDRTVRSMGLNALRQCRRDDQIAALSRLSRMLDPQHEDRPENRAAAVRLCGALKSDAASAVNALETASTSDPDAKVRGAALVAIAQIVEPAMAVSPLAKGLRDHDPAVRRVAATRLKQSAPAAAPVAGELAVALADSNSDVAELAAEALIVIGAPAVQPLGGQLSTGSAQARKLALACLAKIGPAAKAAMPKIEACKQDPDPQVRQLAEAALKRISGP
jgi:hypothetical protein